MQVVAVGWVRSADLAPMRGAVMHRWWHTSFDTSLLMIACTHDQDPEGILAAPKAGHIARRMVAKQAAENEELKEQMAKAREEARQELTQKREVGSMQYRSCTSSMLSRGSLCIGMIAFLIWCIAPSAEPQATRVARGADRVPARYRRRRDDV
jgi:hypothetical protein